MLTLINLQIEELHKELYDIEVERRDALDRLEALEQEKQRLETLNETRQTQIKD